MQGRFTPWFQWPHSFHFKLANTQKPGGKHRGKQKYKNRKKRSTNPYDLYNSSYFVLVFESLNEFWSVSHYSPSGAVVHFVWQFLVILAQRWLFCFMLMYYIDWKLPVHLPPKKQQSWKGRIYGKSFLYPSIPRECSLSVLLQGAVGMWEEIKDFYFGC